MAAGFSRHGAAPVCLVACRVFAPALECLGLTGRPGLVVRFLPSHLHLKPRLLRMRLEEELADAAGRGQTVVVLYGECIPEMGSFCGRRGAVKVAGDYCYEMLLGAERYRRIMDRSAGTFFAERELLCDFERLCLQPLELDDPAMRAACFAHYRHLVYLRQPDDPELENKAAEVARLLELEWDVAEADYRHLAARVEEAVGRARGGNQP